jgi:aminopeptidase N
VIFSAPAQLDFEQTDAELAHLMAHDADALNRWEAGQRLATRVLLAGIAGGGEGSSWIPADLVAACARVLDAGLTHDPALAQITVLSCKLGGNGDLPVFRKQG